MSTQNKRHETGCPVAYGIDTFGDRWTLLVIRDMILNGKRTYGDFHQAGEGIATNILADRLKHLEAEDIVVKARDPENRRSYVYRLTEKGLALAPVIVEIIRWSGKYMTLDDARASLVARIETDRDGLIDEIHARERARATGNAAPCAGPVE